MFLELFMIFSCIDSYQKDKRIKELEMRETERQWARKYGINIDAPQIRKEEK